MIKIQYLTAADMGRAREHLFFRNGRQIKNPPQDKMREVFCSIEMRNGIREHFWMQRTEVLEAFFAQLFQDNRYNQHIHFIEWDDRINCVVEDGIYISQTNFFMTKEELEKFRKTIIPYDEYRRETYDRKTV